MRLRRALNGLSDKVIGVLGISFKPNTDDIREAPALEIIHLLQNEGATVRAYDPAAMEVAAEELPKVTLCKDPYEVAQGTDAILLATEWNEFKHLDFERIRQVVRQPIILDGRNLWDRQWLERLGFTYYGIGQGVHVNGE